MVSSSQHDGTDESVVGASWEDSTLARPDLVLLALPAFLLAGWGAGVLSSVSLVAAIAVAVLPALATLGYALFCAPPSARAGAG